ncbi:hypothetical protein [uncultured Nostoc sp.]|uniref:hypothetical protein n=1 Tax=uncultured Nostoc sp. TaxID=340711 RepID=UPI0035CA21D4
MLCRSLLAFPEGSVTHPEFLMVRYAKTITPSTDLARQKCLLVSDRTLCQNLCNLAIN